MMDSDPARAAHLVAAGHHRRAGIAGLEEPQFEAALRRSIEQRRPVVVQREWPT